MKQLYINLAPVRLSKLLFLSLFLFAGAVLILALPLRFSRFSPRLSALLHQINPANVRPSAPTSTLRSMTTSTMAPAAFKTPPQAPPTFIETPESVLKETHRLIDWARSRQDKLVAQIKPAEATFENAVLPGTRDEDALGLEVNLLGFYQAVSSSAKLRDASTEADRLLNDFAIESSMREDVYKLYDAVLKKGEKLDAESQRLAEKSYKNFIQNGLNIPAGPKRERFREIAKRLSELAITFSRNLNEEKGGLWFTPEELEGVPQDVTSTLKRGEGENEAKLWLTFKYPDYFPTMKYAKHAATRKRVRIAYDNKTNQNVPLFTETIILRDEAARLLGYPNHAAFKIEDKMAESPEAVDSFLADLRKRLKGGGEEEANVLKAMKKADLEARGLEKEFDNHYFIWDHNFYDRLLLEKHYSLNHQKIAEYFPLSTSIRGMMHIFEEIFGMVFVEILDQDRAAISPTGKGEDIVWHPDVQIFSVWDDEGEGGEFVGYLYLDLHPREGKYGHAANFNLQPGFKYDNGTRRYPATALVCNFSKPTKTKPSLLKHDEVVTLFHGRLLILEKLICLHRHSSSAQVLFTPVCHMIRIFCTNPLLASKYENLIDDRLSMHILRFPSNRPRIPFSLYTSKPP